MEQMVIGKTGLKVNRLGFGGIPIQRVSETEAVETVLHAIQKGVDFIDTSRAYTTSERRIGLALRQVDKQVILASKSPNKTADGARADLETSLKELQKGYIDLYQCHFVKDAAEYQKTISAGGAFEGLMKAKEEGLIGHLGITSHSLDVLDLALEGGIPKAIRKKIGVIAMKPFSGGVIDNAGLALKYALSQPEVLVIAGVEHKDLFDENWAIFQNGERLSNKERKEIEEIQKQYNKVFCRRCDYCQPCSEEIPIQMVLGIRSMVKRMGKGILQKGRHREALDKARNCSECEECMARCPYQLPIPNLIHENLRWAEEELKSM
ncbi:MAG: aldo/keto reductase [Deltaproteobacteria bacterium]|nr:aldo/keto reductase [Deltaproteobacteria bacterium]